MGKGKESKKKNHKEHHHKKKSKKDSKKDRAGKRSKSKKQHRQESPSSSSSSNSIQNFREFGPQLPETSENFASIGPQLPPEIALHGSDDAGPSMGPELPVNISIHEVAPSTEPDKPRAPVKQGPTLPQGVDLEKLAAMRDRVDWQRLNEEEEEEEEDLVGPAAPGQETSGFLRASAAAEARAYNKLLSEMEAEAAEGAPKHEEWMTTLPEERALGLTLDQMQQNRTFGRREEAPAAVRDGSSWTDTPADRERKARERRLGLKRPAPSPAGPERPGADSAAQAAAVAIAAYNAQARPRSLVEMHREAQARAGSGDKAKELGPGEWDHGSVGAPRQMDRRAADKLLQEAQTLDSRFGGRHFHGL